MKNHDILFTDVIGLVNRWAENQIAICVKYDIEFDNRYANDEGHFTIFGPAGDYIAQIIAGDPTFAPYRYVMFDILKISTDEIVYFWQDEGVSLEDIAICLEQSMRNFIELSTKNLE